MVAPTSASSQGSEDSTLPLKPSGSPVSDRSSGTPPVPESSSDTGPTSPDGEMLLPTPRSQMGAAEQPSSQRAHKGGGRPRRLEVEIPSISSAAGSHANPSAQQGDAAPNQTSDGCGPSSPASFVKFNRDWSSSKTSLAFCQLVQNWSPQMTDAYAAGLIDGEGSIGIFTAGRKTKTYHPRVDVMMSEKALPVLKAMHKDYGGQLRKERDAQGKWEAVWSWRLLGRDVVKTFLTQIRPHLILKRQQADLALKLLALTDELPLNKRGHHMWTEVVRRDAQVMKALMHDLNRRGPTTTPQATPLARYVGGMWMTDQGSLLEPTGLGRFSGTWPRWGSMHDGRVFAHPTPERVTSESASSSWLGTPTAQTGGDSPEHGHELLGPQIQRQMLHTPTTGDTAPTYDHRASPGYTRAIPVPNLAAQVDDLLPTPRGRDKGTAGDVTGSEMTGGPNLTETVLSLGDHTKPESEGGNE